MSELVPGTPEYQEAYDKEMQRLEAGATKETVKTESNDAAITSEKKEEVVKTEEVQKTETTEELKARLETTEKALKDTQRWAHNNAAEIARLKKDRDADKHASQRPPILDQNPGLEDAIKHVAVPPEKAKPPEEIWLESVSQAVPDVDNLLSDPVFRSKAEAKRAELGSEWLNPLNAIRELSDLKVSHLRDKAVQGAVESARKDFEAKAKKLKAMEVPGGSGGGGSKAEDEVKKVWDMSDADFNKQRTKVLGY